MAVAAAAATGVAAARILRKKEQEMLPPQMARAIDDFFEAEPAKGTDVPPETTANRPSVVIGGLLEGFSARLGAMLQNSFGSAPQSNQTTAPQDEAPQTKSTDGP